MPDSPSPSPHRWLVALPLIALLGWLVVTMWQWGTADLRLRWARGQMDGWTTAPGFDEWRAVRNVLAEARDSRPQHPDAHEQLARLYALGANDRMDPLAKALLRQARASYETALGLRPASPYTWAGLAWVTHRLGDDEAFADAFERADTLGPWELEVQLAVIGLGQARWERLTVDQRERTLAAARRALAQKSRELVAYAKRVGLLAWLCTELAQPAGLGRDCPE